MKVRTSSLGVEVVASQRPAVLLGVVTWSSATDDDISLLSSTGRSVSFEEKLSVFFPRLMW